MTKEELESYKQKFYRCYETDPDGWSEEMYRSAKNLAKLVDEGILNESINTSPSTSN